MTNQEDIVELLSIHYGDYLDRRNIEIGFPGGFLNFGYWEDISLESKLSLEDRIDSQRGMYRIVLESLDVAPEDVVLEIASGRGSGCVLAIEEFTPAKVCGIDILPRQIERSKKYNADALSKYSDRLRYKVGSGSDIPYAANTFDKVFCVEAFIYFYDLDRCMREIRRVMRTPARFSAACVFATSPEVSAQEWLHLFDRSGVARGFAISDVTSKLAEFGFTEVNCESIGEYVWSGYREYVAQNFDIDNPMSERWYGGFKRGLFDYYLLSAKLSN